MDAEVRRDVQQVQPCKEIRAALVAAYKIAKGEGQRIVSVRHFLLALEQVMSKPPEKTNTPCSSHLPQ